MRPGFFVVLVSFLFCVSKPASGQITTAEGYIINTSGATEAGRLEYVNANLPGKRVFIPAGTKNVTLVSPETINGFYINPEISFKTLPFKGKKVFMKVVSEGTLNLYAYKGNLLVKTGADSLVLLTGGPKTVTKDGKKYAVVDYSYKTQLRKALNAPGFDSRLNSLQFGEENISSLAREINGQTPLQTKPELKNAQQFEVSLGYTSRSIRLKNMPYSNSSAFTEESFLEKADIDFMPGEKQNFKALSLGIFYKQKVARKYSYLKAGLVYNHAFNTQETQTHKFYNAIGYSEEGGTYPADFIGKDVDAYSYKLNTLELPVTYFADLADGKIRPFIDIGFTFKTYKVGKVSLKRETYDTQQLIATEAKQVDLPDLTIGPTLTLGCRFFLSEHNSLMAGLRSDAWIPLFSNPSHNLRRSAGLNIFVGFGL